MKENKSQIAPILLNDSNMIILYRLKCSGEHSQRFYDLLKELRPGESKIQRIDPGLFAHNIDVKITNEELVFLKLSIPGLIETGYQYVIENG